MTTDPNLDEYTENKPAEISRQCLEILLKEFDTLKELYIQLENSSQNLFNFYLSLVIAMAGGAILLFQATSKIGTTSSLLVISALLYFMSAYGVFYSGTLSHKYAHMIRYSQALDDLRLYLLTLPCVHLPPAYLSFTIQKPHEVPQTTRWLSKNDWYGNVWFTFYDRS